MGKYLFKSRMQAVLLCAVQLRTFSFHLYKLNETKIKYSTKLILCSYFHAINVCIGNDFYFSLVEQNLH